MPSVVNEPSVTELADELLEAVSGFRRAVRRVAQPSFGPLTGSQVELLRLVRTQPGVSVSDAAVALRLAGNTVSTLVGQLLEAGLLLREADAADRRVARLRLTPSAAKSVGAWRSRRAAAVAGTLDGLSVPDRRRIQGAVDALRLLTESLETP